MGSQYPFIKYVFNEDLGKHKYVKGYNKAVVEKICEDQLREWEMLWEKKQAAQAAKQNRIEVSREKEQLKAKASEATKIAQKELDGLDNVLLHSLKKSSKVVWVLMKNTESYGIPKPKPLKLFKKPDEPVDTDSKYQPYVGLLGLFLKMIREQRKQTAIDLFNNDHAIWKKRVKTVEAENDQLLREQKVTIANWEQEEKNYRLEQEKGNTAVDEIEKLYEEKNPEAIANYCSIVLDNSQYPDYFPQEFELDYNPNNGILAVDYSLPAPNVIPRVKEVKYIQSRNEFSDVLVSESDANKRYDSLLYQICLRTIRELFEADIIDALNTVIFNGWVSSIDPSTGKETNSCVLSVSVNKAAFQEVDLAHVDPKACFKAFKGVGSSALHSLTAIAPVLKLDKNDSRFISSYQVAGALDDSVNLAAMDWADFEHLIRELFEEVFSATGGEVKVTQASRDGGVDAIAFDPDPIRGGKIVIQAKRYTNVVGVSAVRDLFGTVMNEGATKGILVTTADYGSDAYEFAKGKPLTLLNGSNLLSLLEQHGHKAKIDIREAKRVLNEKE